MLVGLVALLTMSIAALALAIGVARRLAARHDGWNAALMAGVLYIALIAAAFVLMPAINEVPETFSAVVLWHFRLAALGIHLILWGAIGLLFGFLTQRALAQGLSRLAATPR